MDCKDKCANYKALEVERPADHPNRIFAEDLRVGMVIRRHGTYHGRKLIVILGEVEKYSVPSLQLLAGHKPCELGVCLTAAGLKPYDSNGEWKPGAWCEEVT